MATRSPMPTAPELSAAGNSGTPSQWDQFGDGNTANNNNCSSSGSNSSSSNNTNTEREANQPSAPDIADLTDNVNTPKTSTTAYSFAGSALGRDSVTTANLNENLLRKDTKKDNTSNSTTTTTTSTNPNTNKAKDQGDDKSDESFFECNICLDTAKDAVVSMCGHLFCWPCLHQWLETRPNRKLCPVCKSAIDRDKVIPLYGRNSTKQEDPRNKVPPRPAGHRTEPESQQGFQGLGFGDGFHMSFGIGAFPFGFFASSFNIGDPRPTAANRGTTQYEDEQQLSKLFLYLALMCIAWLLFA